MLPAAKGSLPVAAAKEKPENLYMFVSPDKTFLSAVCLVSCPTRSSSRDQRNIAKRCATVCYGASDHPAEESAQEAAHSTLGNIDVIYQY